MQRVNSVSPVRASRAGHNFHEYWAARRALQLVFPRDRLHAIAVESISTSDPADPGPEAEDIADLCLYFGTGDTFATANAVQTIQFKYKVDHEPVTSSYLKKTVQKFAKAMLGYEKEADAEELARKLSFAFVTNAPFSPELWDAISSIRDGTTPPDTARAQFNSLTGWCLEAGVEARRLFAVTEFRASELNLPVLKNRLRRTLVDWSAGADGQARGRLYDLVDLVLEKAGPGGERNNLIRREDVLDALGCDPEDLFPADTHFMDVGEIVERSNLGEVIDLVRSSRLPVFIHADGGVGKTVFIQSLAAKMASEVEVVVFDCFGGGGYRSEGQSRHLPKVGLVQITNELASRGLCDPLLPGDNDTRGLIKAARKRLGQAAAAVKEQSGKNGILVVLDAADNAQLEADNRKEESFPRLFLASLSEAPVDGVKLLLTARPHRMPGVVGRSKVIPYVLGPFSEGEARAFVYARRPNAPQDEVSRALARSGRNARVLAYLLETWDRNVSGNATSDAITVEDIIRQQCEKIFEDLRVAGWQDNEIREFFAAISLLPPPIPLGELASALGWSFSQVNSAASDLAPMLENLPQGAIFRDEPTETYIWDLYSREASAQQAIARRLDGSQATSAYAAEALPGFLVAIGDSNRAYALASSSTFPKSIQSDYGRRRLSMARLHAAFRLAVREGDLDRVLKLTTLLAQVAAANARGDQFIRRAPALGVCLGDRDVSRRLFNDRTGWRGARNARLAIAYSFTGDFEEARIHRNRAIGWINWNAEKHQEERSSNDPGPVAFDFAAVILLAIIDGAYESADENLCRWTDRFSVSVSQLVVALIVQHEQLTGSSVLGGLADFAAGKSCKSYALKLALLSYPSKLTQAQVRSIGRGVRRASGGDDPGDTSFDDKRVVENAVASAATSALFAGTRQSALRLLKTTKALRPSSHDYGERYGFSRAWLPILLCCIRAWSSGRQVGYADLLPSEIKRKRWRKPIGSKTELRDFLDKLVVPARQKREQKPPRAKGKRQPKYEPQFSDEEKSTIVAAIELILALIAPIESAFLKNGVLTSDNVMDFLSLWSGRLRTRNHWRSEEALDVLSRTVGFGLAKLIFEHATDIAEPTAAKLIETVLTNRFSIGDRTAVLALLAERSNLRAVSGRFAQTITEGIRKGDSIEQRGEHYGDLAAALVSMSVEEARTYYAQGLAELDQMGGDDYDLIYALLHYAAEQRGGLLPPALGHRLMNLCQTICHNEPSKFGWTLFARAMASSVGWSAAFKLLRWDDQDVAEFSYGLPQLACFLAMADRFDPRRAAVLLAICEDHGWPNGR